MAWPYDETWAYGTQGIWTAWDILPHAKIRYIRHDFDYSIWKGAGENWANTAYDWLVYYAGTKGATLLPILKRTMLNPTTGQYVGVPPRTTEEVTDFYRFAHSAAARYGINGSFWTSSPEAAFIKSAALIRCWEIWNEPNYHEFWWNSNATAPATPDPAEYHRMLRFARLGLRSADPEARIVFGGLRQKTSVPDSYGTQFIDGVLAVPNGNGSVMFDAVSYHPYATQSGSVYETYDLSLNLRQFLVNRGLAEVPIWPTEVGWSSEGPAHPCNAGSLEGQADQLHDLISGFRPQRAALNLGPLFWWRLNSEVASPDFWFHHAGLRRSAENNFQLKPAWYRFRDTIADAGFLPMPPVRGAGIA